MALPTSHRGIVRTLGAGAWSLPPVVGRVVLVVTDITRKSAKRLSLPRSAGVRALLWRGVVDQVWFTGVEAVPLVAALATLVGVSTIGVGFRTLHAIGAEAAFGTLLATIIVTELAPLLTAIVVAARAGSAVCTELLAMRLNDEFDALSVHGVDPWVYVGLPRLVGVTVGTTALTVVFALTTYAVTLLSTVPLDIPLPPFAAMLGDAIQPTDVLVLGLKGLFFGLAVAGTTLARGFTWGTDSSDLPRAATRGVVDALVTIFLIDALFAVLVN